MTSSGLFNDGPPQNATPTTIVRPATVEDLPRMASLAAQLVRMHHDLDPARFFVARGVEDGYRAWFGRELAEARAVLLVADRGDDLVVGYAYGRMEPRDWNMLLDRHAALHDVLVEQGSRGHGVAEALLEAFVERVRAAGAPRVVLHTAIRNERAQALFKRLGFRPTMLEMTRELEPGVP